MIAAKSMTALAQRFLQRVAQFARRAIKWIIWATVFVITMFIIIGLIANNMSSSREVKAFIADHKAVTSFTGKILEEGVVIHSLSASSSEGDLSIDAEAVASGPLGQVRVVLKGQKFSSDEQVRFRLISVQPVRCHLIFVCNILPPTPSSRSTMPRDYWP